MDMGKTPVFKDEFQHEIEDTDDLQLKIEIWEWDKLSEDDFLGIFFKKIIFLPSFRTS